VIDTGGPIRIPLQAEAVRRVMSSVENVVPSRAFMETGIKVIDLMVPLPRRGRLALAGSMHAGKMVLVDEVIHRLAGTDAELTIYVFVQTPDEATAINALEYRASPNVSAIYLPVADASPKALAEVTTDLDAVVTFSQELARRQFWPAIDPLQSRSRLLEQHAVGKDHQEIAEQMRNALAGGDEETIHQLRAFLAQPFFVAEPYTGQAGANVPLEEAIRECTAILGARG